jgi:hypothetical protein
MATAIDVATNAVVTRLRAETRAKSAAAAKKN